VKALLTIFTVSFLVVGCSGGRNSTGYSIINDMMYSITYEAFTKSDIHPDGQSMQLAPKGTIARGFMPHPKDADGNPVVLKNPYPETPYSIKRGEHLWNVTCTACHGAKGGVKGTEFGEVVKRGFPKPPKFDGRRYKWSKREKYTSGTIYNVITFGQGNMPSHAQQLYPQDRWYVAEFVRNHLMVKGKK
jgi:cytochrome c5